MSLLPPTELRELLLAALARVAMIDRSLISEDTPLDGLGFDSLLFTSFLLEVEDALGGELPEGVLAGVVEANFSEVMLVGDLVALLLAATAPPAQ
jgi:acyl carrier protein